MNGERERCEMRGHRTADGYKHLTSRLVIKSNYRCPNPADFVSSGGTRFCAACGKHVAEMKRAEIRLAQRELEAIATAKRIATPKGKRKRGGGR